MRLLSHTFHFCATFIFQTRPNTELRPGKQHCQNHTPDFLRQTIALGKSLTDKALLFRLDSGNDVAENMGILLRENCWFIVKRNLRKESKDARLEEMKKVYQDIERPRDGKTIYIGSTWKDVVIAIGNGPLRYGLSMRLPNARLTNTDNICSRPILRSICSGQICPFPTEASLRFTMPMENRNNSTANGRAT